MRRIALAMVRELLAVQGSCIVDGGWLDPDEASALSAEYGALFHPSFCGYHDANLECRLGVLKEAGRHWLTREPDDAALSFLVKQRADSETVRVGCGRLGMRYFDFTSFDAGFRALSDDFLLWLNAER